MAKYTIETTDDQDAGVTAVREARNAGLPKTVTVDEKDVPNPDLMATNDEYIAFVMAGAFESYQKQHKVGEFKA